MQYNVRICRRSPAEIVGLNPVLDMAVQGDQKLSVHLTITVKNTQNILNSFNHHDNVVRIRDNRWR
jgi:hypothetical protein